MTKTISLLSLLPVALLASHAGAAQAIPAKNSHIIAAPVCLLKQVNTPYTTLATTSDLALIRISQNHIEKLIEAKSHHPSTPCGGFIDVTTDWDQQKLNAAHPAAFLAHFASSVKTEESDSSYKIQHQPEVHQLLNTLNPDGIWASLTQLTQYNDRYANSKTGVSAAAWIQTTLANWASQYNRQDVSIYTVATTQGYKQPSVVMKIGDSTAPGIVIGAHMDTLSGQFSPKPGADDDGSGSSTALEVARVILASGMHFKKPLYFIWYSAEEEGLIGSGDVVRDFKAKQIPVSAVLQMDMTGYEYQNDPTLWLITDYTNNDLTAYLNTLITTYVKRPVNWTRCGYACSDHASWHHAGITAAFAVETKFGEEDPYLHTSNDKMSVMSLEHMTDFAKLGIAFAVELAEPDVA